MNQELIKFIELCLMDGVVTDKEREVILRKSKKLGVPEDECEIILEGMIQQHKNNSTKSEPTQEVSPTPHPKEETSSSTEQNRLLTKDDIEGYDDMSQDEQIKQMNIILEKNTEYLEKLKSQNPINEDVVREEGELDENGNRIGVWRLYTDDKNWKEGEFDENGNKTGIWKSYWKDEIRSETPYVNGKKHGDVISHMGIEPFIREKYKNDILVYSRINKRDSIDPLGIEEFDDNGQILRNTSYHYQTEKIQRIKKYIDGIIHSEETFHRNSEKLESLTKYDSEGVIINRKSYHENDTLESEEIFEKGEPKHSKNFYDDGSPSYEVFFKDGEKQKQVGLYSDGSINFEIFYKDGKEEKSISYQKGKIWYEKYYSEKGKLIKEIQYDRDTLDLQTLSRVNIRTEKIFDEKGQLLNEIKTNFEDDEY